MVRKGKKEKQVRNDDSVQNTNPWSDFPDQLTKLVMKQFSPAECVSFSCVSKTWRSAPRQCNPTPKSPWLELSDHKSSSIKLYNNRWNRHRRTMTKDSWEYCVDSSNDELLMRGAKASTFFLSSRTTVWDTIPRPLDSSVHYYKHVFLPWSQDSAFNCRMLVLTGGSHPILVDPNSSCKSHTIQFTNAIGFGGKFYALSLQGTLAVIDFDDSHPRVKIFGAIRAIPSTMSRGFREYLLESRGDILVVFLISRKSINIVDDIEVFRLDLSKPSWIKMESLGDRTLFMGRNRCMSVSASKLGCRSNCIYFTHCTIDGWWVFDMDDGSISPGWNAGSVNKSPVWTTPCSLTRLNKRRF